MSYLGKLLDTKYRQALPEEKEDMYFEAISKIDKQDARIKELETALNKMCEHHEKQATYDKGDNGYYKAKRLLNSAQ